MRKRNVKSAAALLGAFALAACGSSSPTSSAGAGASPTTGAATTSSPSSSAGGATTASATTGAGATIGYERVPLESGPQLAPASTTQTGPVGGITCGSKEQLAYHIHAHLAVFDNGVLYSLPAGIGIPGSRAQQTSSGPYAVGGTCIYWLHTHTSDGIIHVESPLKAILTLGNFFDEWHQPLTGTRVGDLHGKARAYVNGRLWTQTPRAIPLLSREDIQLDIGEPTPPILQIDWSKTGL